MSEYARDRVWVTSYLGTLVNVRAHSVLRAKEQRSMMEHRSVSRFAAVKVWNWDSGAWKREGCGVTVPARTLVMTKL